MEQSVAGLKSNCTSGDDTVNDENVVMTGRGTRTQSVVSDYEGTEEIDSSTAKKLPPLAARRKSTMSYRKRLNPSNRIQRGTEVEKIDVGIVPSANTPQRRGSIDNPGNLEMRGEFRMAFSVDDKGQTLLSVFGLPPLSHQSEPEQAIKAMVEFVDFAKEYLDGRVTVGVSTGEILFASIGTDSRREASLLGDVVNIAARLMTLNNYQGMIVADEMTHLGSINIFIHDDIGDHHVILHTVRVWMQTNTYHQLKGKEIPLRLWTLTRAQAHDLHEPSVDDTLCGYDEERATLTEMYLKWKKEAKPGVALIEASSGLGKSKLGSFVSNKALDDNIPVCLVQGTEIEQRT
ncbi:hypothetical protein HDU76_002182 [Blyttiomyces sp. JEL0837]|nr:hypothetical protein HDU76_002182 [Blyttiomyces sp. JEL0837]